MELELVSKLYTTYSRDRNYCFYIFFDKNPELDEFDNNYHRLVIISSVTFIVFYIGILIGDDKAEKKWHVEYKKAIDAVKNSKEFELLSKKINGNRKIEWEMNAFRGIAGFEHLVEVIVKDQNSKNMKKSYFSYTIV